MYLGNLDARRDWGHARDYVKGMWMMLQQDKPDDYVFATGEAHSVREFVEKSFKLLGILIGWKGKGLEEEGYVVDFCDKEIREVEDSKPCVKKGDSIIFIDPKYFRPTEVDFLLGDPTKAKQKLGWESRASFDELVKEMVESDVKEARRLVHLDKGGFEVKEHFEI